MREIVLDTETTGLDPKNGDRLIEIGCVELYNRIPTGREFHQYLNPLREVPAEAQAVHGITTDFLKDKPLFENIVDSFLEFISEDLLVIHNATFDMSFLNAELERSQRTSLQMSRVVDTLALARRKFPGGPNSLDALCKRFSIDNSQREKHGALKDSLLLAEVYVELLGERQAKLELSQKNSSLSSGSNSRGQKKKTPQRPTPLPSRLTPEEEASHRAFVETLGPSAIWHKYLAKTE